MYVLRPLATAVMRFALYYTIIGTLLSMMLIHAGITPPQALLPPIPFFTMDKIQSIVTTIATAAITLIAIYSGLPRSTVATLAISSFLAGAVLNLFTGLATIAPLPLLASMAVTAGEMLYIICVIYLVLKAFGVEL